jgi:hypothetical protein
VAPFWNFDEGPLAPSILDQQGDYNDDGFVNAADYVLWRKRNNTTFQLANEHPNASPGMVDTFDYTVFQAFFGLPSPMDLGQPSDFTHILDAYPPNPPAPNQDGRWQHWFEPFAGTNSEQEDNFAHLYQDVPGTPGLQYTMTGWAMGEQVFAGGVTNLNAEGTGAPFNDGPLSPTNVYFALEFLDATGVVLAGSVEKELKDDLGFVNSGDPDLEGYLWQQFTLTGVAPAGTETVRVRASMIDGVANPTPEPQSFRMSFFVDAFSLTATSPGSGGGVPEPSAWLIAAIGAAFAGMSGGPLRRTRA